MKLKNIQAILFAVTFAIAFNSCRSDVDIAGNYKETTVVYGLLNQYDTVQYVRIQKAFLVNDNVLDYTKVPDSIYFKPEDLNVVIEKLNPNSNLLEQTITMTPTQLPKDSGIFASGNMLIYKTNAALDSSRIYRLKITNNKTGKVITGKTKLINGLVIKNPNSYSTTSANLNPPSKNGYDIRWKPANNAVLYQVEITFKFTEINVVTGDTKPDSIIWSFAPVYRTGSGDITYNLPQHSFFQFVQEKVPYKENVQRKIGKLTFKIYAGTDELYQYTNINKPSTGLIQEKPLYTNIENGLGIFSARAFFLRKDVELTKSPTRDTLRLGKYTGNLAFIE